MTEPGMGIPPPEEMPQAQGGSPGTEEAPLGRGSLLSAETEDDLIEAQKQLSAEVESLVNTINAPRAPRSPNSKHVSSRLEVEVGTPGIEAEALADPLSLEKEEEGVEEIEIDEEEEAGIRIQLSRKAGQAEGAATAAQKREDSMHHFYGTPKSNDKTNNREEAGDISAIAMPNLSTESAKETEENAVEKGKISDSFLNKGQGVGDGGNQQSSPTTGGKPLKKKASFTDDILQSDDKRMNSVSDDRASFSGENRRRTPTPSSMKRPVSREEVAEMIIPPFSPGMARSESGGSDQARVSRPMSRELLMSGGRLRSPGLRPLSSSLAEAVVEQPGEREGDDSSVSSLHDGESVDSSGLPRGDGGGGGGGAGGGGGGDKDGDDSTVSSLNSTDQALMGNLRKGLGEAVNAEAATGAGGTDEQYFDALFNQGRASLEDDDGDGSGSPDGELGAGVQNVSVGAGTEDPEVAAAMQIPLDLSEFDFATGSYVTDGTSPQKGGAMGLVVSPTHEHEFTDAMAVRPRTNERPSSTQQKYLDMYARAQTPVPLHSLEGLELEIGPLDEPQSARSVNSQLTMSTLDTISVRSGVSPVRREEKAPRASTIPFPFQRPPGLPHVDTGIKDDRLRYESIKKPFLTQSDEAHNKIRAKLLRKQERKRAKIAALMEVERRRKERRDLLLADFSREQVTAAMDYFRTMCAQLSKEASQRVSKSNNQDDGTVSTANTHSSIGSGASTVNRTSGKNRSKKKKKKEKKGGVAGRADAAAFKGQGRYAPAQEDEMRLDELEAVLRKYRRAEVTMGDQEHGRDLLLSLEWLLDELEMSPMEWFHMVDSRGGTKTGDRKLTYLELSRGVDMLCDELGRKMTRRQKTEAREARERARQARREALMEERGRVADSPAGSSRGTVRLSRGPSPAPLAPSPLTLQVDAAAANADDDEALLGVGPEMHLPPESPSRIRDVEVPHWRRQDLHALLRYLDPNGDGDISVCEMKLAFKNLHLSPESHRVVEDAGPIIRRMVEYMHEKQLTVKDLFTLIDTDRSMTISTDELFRAMNTFFKKPPTEEEEEDRREKMMALAALDLDSSGSLDSGDELSLGGTLGASMGQSTTDPVSMSYGTRGWADASVSVSGASKVGSVASSRFGPSLGPDMGSSWQPRGTLNSRGKHVFLRKSASSVVLRPVKTRKSSQNQSQVQGRVSKKSSAGDTGGGRASAAGTADGKRSRAKSRNDTASSMRSERTRSGIGSRLNSSETAAKDMLKGGRRAGAFVGEGLPGLGIGGVSSSRGNNSNLGSGNVANALSLLTAKGAPGSTTSKSTRLANAKLLPRHKNILDCYGDLFDRQYDELSISLPKKGEAKAL